MNEDIHVGQNIAFWPRFYGQGTLTVIAMMRLYLRCPPFLPMVTVEVPRSSAQAHLSNASLKHLHAPSQPINPPHNPGLEIESKTLSSWPVFQANCRRAFIGLDQTTASSQHEPMLLRARLLAWLLSLTVWIRSSFELQLLRFLAQARPSIEARIAHETSCSRRG